MLPPNKVKELENQISEIETEKGWQPLEISSGSATLDLRSGSFEVVIDMRLDSDAEGQLDYTLGEAGNSCAGRYQILNDATLGEGRPTSSLMGSYTDKYSAENLSEPGRPKRVYSTESWNRVRIMVTEDRIQHWLNSVKVVDYPKCEAVVAPSDAARVMLKLVTQSGQIETRNAKVRPSP